MPKSIGSLKERFLFFGRNSSIHGLNRLFRKHASSTARLFWLTIMVLSSGCLYLLLITAVNLNQEINFTPNTLYLNWTTTFPGVTICDMYSSSGAARRLKELYPDLLEPLSFDQRRYLVDLLHGRGKCTPTRCIPCGTLVACDVPWRKVMENVHKKCEELITDCSYMGKEFSCCKLFHLVDSEYGSCYSFNTLQNSILFQERLFTVNRTTGPGILTLRLTSNSIINIHSSEELSTNNLGTEYDFFFYMNDNQEAEILFSVVEVENDPMINHMNIENRDCRFPHEVPEELFHTYPVYSYGACKLARNTEHSYKHCGCVSPIRDLSYEKFYCNYTGLHCLAKHEAQKKLGLETDDHQGECLPSCVESELFIIHDKRTPSGTGQRGKGNFVTIRMSSLPTLRYQRNLLTTKMDFVVSMGGMVGLFFSASLLSAVEIFYLMLRTPSKPTEMEN